jgi:hypothetical protein
VVFELVTSGPPEDLTGYPPNLDPRGDIRIAIAPTGNPVEMLIFGHTDPPIIAIVGIRERPLS